jgi:catechol 2,3-dioxygenase-like lactoylglutathione lyase family enzyme
MVGALVGLMISALCACAFAAGGQDGHELRFEPGGGWHEAVINVSDLERTGRFFVDVAGWKVVAEGAVGRDELAYLGASASAASGRYRVYRAMDYPRGWVRLIELRGVAQRMIRPHAQPWDTGGIFSIMTRSADLEANLRAAERLGWLAYNEPYDFGFGDLQLRNVVLRGPDGLNVAIYEWTKPRRTDVQPGVVSKAFNSMQMVRDLAVARRFCVEQLGFEVLQEGAFLDAENRPTNFALPVSHATKIPRNYVILLPPGASKETGRVELMEFRGFEGRDLSANTSLTHLGIVALRFPVPDVEAAYARVVAKNGAPQVRAIQKMPMPPFGVARAFTVRSPDGAFLTFFELAK